MKKYFIVFMLVFLSACMASTPKINIIDTMGMTMELNKSAGKLTTVVISSDGKYGLSAGDPVSISQHALENAPIWIWDLSAGRLSNSFVSRGSNDAVAFSPDGKFIVSASSNDNMKLWDLSSGKEIRQFPMRGYCLAFSPDGGKILSCVRDIFRTGGLVIWDAKTGEKIKEIVSPSLVGKISVLDAVYSPDGKYFLTGEIGSDNAIVRLWDAATGSELKKFAHHSTFFGATFIQAVDISHDGKYALGGGSGSFGGSIPLNIWDIASGKHVREITGPQSGLSGLTSAKFSPDDKYILSAGSDQLIKLWDASSGEEIRRFVGHSGNTYAPGVKGNRLYAAFSPDGKRILSAGNDAALRVWDVSSGKEIAMMVGFDDGEWLAITSEGYYNSSEKGAQYLTVKYGEKNYTVDQFYDVFFRPDIVAAKLRGEDIKDLITISMQDAIKTPPPAVEFTALPQETDQAKVKVCYRVQNTGGGIGEVRLFQNGKLIKSDGYYRDMAKSASGKPQLAAMDSKAIYENMRSVSLRSKGDAAPLMSRPKGDLYEDCKEVETVSGENEVSVAAFNSVNTVQSSLKTLKFISRIKPEEPHLYILSIGIDRYRDRTVNLRYAAKDAADVEEKLIRQSATMYNPRNIHSELMTDAKANKGDILRKISELSRVIKPNDGFILFVAGHGVLLQNQYYMLTHDFDGAVSDTSMISSNELVEMSKNIKSLSQLFIFDTCHAGGVDTIVSGLYDARMSVLAKKMGLHIYASANSVEEAQDGYQGNGLFTYTLLDGLNNKKEADKNNDHQISLVELGEYAKQVTTELSKKNGRSQTPIIINFGRDSALYNLK